MASVFHSCLAKQGKKRGKKIQVAWYMADQSGDRKGLIWIDDNVMNEVEYALGNSEVPKFAGLGMSG